MAGNRVLEPPRNLDPQLRLRSSMYELEARVALLERQVPAPLRYVGATGEPAFQNGWKHYDANSTVPNTSAATYRNCGFYRDRGRVYLQGIISAGTIGNVVFTLPEGYWSMIDGAYQPTISNSVLGSVIIYADGRVTAITGSNAWFSLDGVSFRV